MMQRFIIILLTTFLIVLQTFANNSQDDFDDYEKQDNNKRVILREGNLSKKISIFLIRGNIGLNKLIRPAVKLYINTTTENFRLSVQDGLNSLSSPSSFIDGMLVFSPQRSLSSLGYFAINTSFGLGFVDVAKKLNVEQNKTSLVDVLRFYNIPEVYFFSLGFIPNTFTQTVGLAGEAVRSKYYSLSGGFILDFGINYINSYALNLSTFDILSQMSPELYYENSKNQVYSKVKHFKLERKPLKSKKLALKDYINKLDRF